MNIKNYKPQIIMIGVMVVIISIFMGPGIIKPTGEEIITEFLHLYFEASPSEYDLLFAKGKYNREESRIYIQEQLGTLLTTNGIEKIIQNDSMASHIKNAYIKKTKMAVNQMKITLVKHKPWKDIYSVEGLIYAEQIEGDLINRLEFIGQIIVIEEEGLPKIDDVFMMLDEALYFREL